MEKIPKKPRLSRYSDEPVMKNGKPVVVSITPRVIRVLKAAQRHRFLRFKFLHALVGGSEEALRLLVKAMAREPNMLLRKPPEQWRFANKLFKQMVFELAPNGVEVLKEIGAFNTPEVDYLRHSYRFFEHQLMICDIMASIEIGVKENGLKLISWRDILADAPKKTQNETHPNKIPITFSATAKGADEEELSDKPVIPDGIFGIEYQNSEKAYFALEADRATEPYSRSTLKGSSIMRKILSYREIVKQKTHLSYLGIPNLKTLIVTVSDHNRDKIAEEVARIAANGKSPLFFLKEMPHLGDVFRSPKPDGSIISKPWKRAGYPDVCIDKPFWRGGE